MAIQALRNQKGVVVDDITGTCAQRSNAALKQQESGSASVNLPQVQLIIAVGDSNRERLLMPLHTIHKGNVHSNTGDILPMEKAIQALRTR
jgi:hypothetical protein